MIGKRTGLGGAMIVRPGRSKRAPSEDRSDREGNPMLRGIVGLAACVVLSGVWLMADDRGGGGDDLVKELEGRVQAAEAELAKAKELLAAIRASSQDTRSLEGVWRIVSIDGNRP